MKPRLYGSASAAAAVHGYSEGVEYASMHVAGTAKPFLFVAMPIGTLGAISRSTSHANTGTSVVSVAAGSDGILAEHDGVLRALNSGTIGTDQMRLELSLDGGRSFRPIRLGTASSFTVPDVNATVSFAAGTLVAEDIILEWHGSAPKIDTADLATVRAELAAKQFRFRSIVLCGDLPTDTAASAVVTQLNAYATENDRHIYGRASVFDRNPVARLSQSYGRMTGSPALTFTASSDTMVRDSGSWLADGFRSGDTFVIVGTDDNDGTFVAVTVTADTVTFGNVVVDEVFTGDDASITGGPTLVFAASGDTVTRNRGSWLADGFRVGASTTFDGTTSNDVTLNAVTVTALVLTLADGLADQTIAASGVTVVQGETKAEWMARADAEFESVDGQPRLSLSAGRGAFPSPYSGWSRRVPAGWIASVREYAHDLHITTWRKDAGPTGADLFDADNELIEWDDRVDGEAGAHARFTVLRTWANGPNGGFVSLDLTRAGDGQLASLTNNQAVICHASNITQAATENFIGRTPTLNSDGTATKSELAQFASEVDSQLELELLTSRGEGPRLSQANWVPDPADVYNVAEPLTNGTLTLVLNGVVHSVSTQVRIRSNGQ